MLEIKTYSGNELIFTIAAVIVVLLFLGVLFMLTMIYYDKKKRSMVESFSQTLLQTRLEIQEETFKSISQEIHDNIGQSLSFIKLNISTLESKLASPIKETLTESKELLSKSIQDLRDIARSLSPDFINEIGLENAIKQQLQLLEKTGNYTIHFTAQGEQHKHDQHKELVVFRIVQELLNNIVKHAEASEIKASMDYQQQQLIITIADNGKGFDTATAHSTANNGLGLRNMQSRMTLINGFINIKSISGRGTQATIELPGTTVVL